jgi:hypothetical protein
MPQPLLRYYSRLYLSCCGGATARGSCTPWPIFEETSGKDRSTQGLESLKVEKKLIVFFFFSSLSMFSVEVVDP